jgi:hypothetical protein
VQGWTDLPHDNGLNDFGKKDQRRSREIMGAGRRNEDITFLDILGGKPTLEYGLLVLFHRRD